MFCFIAFITSWTIWFYHIHQLFEILYLFTSQKLYWISSELFLHLLFILLMRFNYIAETSQLIWGLKKSIYFQKRSPIRNNPHGFKDIKQFNVQPIRVPTHFVNLIMPGRSVGRHDIFINLQPPASINSQHLDEASSTCWEQFHIPPRWPVRSQILSAEISSTITNSQHLDKLLSWSWKLTFNRSPCPATRNVQSPHRRHRLAQSQPENPPQRRAELLRLFQNVNKPNSEIFASY
jgi:hypothetical protein